MNVEEIAAQLTEQIDVVRGERDQKRREARRLEREAEAIGAEVDRLVQARDLLTGKSSSPGASLGGQVTQQRNQQKRMAAIVEALREHSPRKNHDLRRELGYGPTAMSHAVAALEREGWLGKAKGGGGPATGGWLNLTLLRDEPYVPSEGPSSAMPIRREGNRLYQRAVALLKRRGALTQRELGNELGAQGGGLSVVLRSMEAEGEIRRERSVGTNGWNIVWLGEREPAEEPAEEAVPA